MVSLFRKKTKAEKVSKFAEDILIKKEVAKEKAKQRIIAFEKRKARAIERARNPLSKRFKGIAVKAGRRTRKDIGKSLKGFAQKVGKPREGEKETLVILGGQPSRRIKGRVRIIRPADTGLGGGLGVGMDTGLGLNVGLLDDKPRKRSKKQELKQFRFF